MANIDQDHQQPIGARTKVCPYCAEQIQADAVVCRFCGREIVSPQKTSSGNGFKLLLVLVAVFFGIIALFRIVGSQSSVDDRIARMERVCQEEFGTQGQDAVFACKMRAMTKYYDELQGEKQRKADRAIR